MRAVRDLILVICAVVSTACLIYIAINLDVPQEDTGINGTPTGLSKTGTPLEPVLPRRAPE